MAEWWKEAFDDSYLHIYARLDRSADQTAGHIVDRLALPPGGELSGAGHLRGLAPSASRRGRAGSGRVGRVGSGDAWPERNERVRSKG